MGLVSGDIMFFICYLNLRDHVINETHNSGWWLLIISHHPVKFGGHRLHGIGDMFFICHVTPCDRVTNE